MFFFWFDVSIQLQLTSFDTTLAAQLKMKLSFFSLFPKFTIEGVCVCGCVCVCACTCTCAQSSGRYVMMKVLILQTKSLVLDAFKNLSITLLHNLCSLL